MRNMCFCAESKLHFGFIPLFAVAGNLSVICPPFIAYWVEALRILEDPSRTDSHAWELLARGHEHLFDLFRPQLNIPDRKRTVFQHKTFVDFAQYSLFTVSEQYAGHAESCLIKSSRASGNTIYAPGRRLSVKCVQCSC